jgi:4'-phosphopantetheinyl transferase
MLTAPVLELPASRMSEFSGSRSDGLSVAAFGCDNQPLSHRPLHSANLSALEESLQLWLLPSLSEAEPAPDTLRALLSDDERARAASFHFPRDRAAFIANRGHLRLLLARYLERPAQALRFVYGPQGKPELLAEDSEGLTFNVSHTEGLAVVAVSRYRRIGVDVEAVKSSNDLLDMARQHFSSIEYQKLASLPSSEQYRAFYTCWTRKEAFLKGLGTGLSQSLSDFEVSLRPNEPAALLACLWSQELCQSWRFHALATGDRYAGALAYELKPRERPLPLHTFTGSHSEMLSWVH